MSIPNRPTLAFAAPVRNEAPYLLEWIAYHRALGVSLFLLGDHSGLDETSRLLRLLHERRIIWRFDWNWPTKPRTAFDGFVLNFATRFADGLFVIDVDEFLHPQTEADTIPEIAMRWLADPSIGAVIVNWAIYGSSGRVEPGDGLVIERFTKRALQNHSTNCIGKSFVRLAGFKGPHNPHRS